MREGGPGGRSSAMAHKRYPAAAVSVLACAARVPGLVATVLGAMAQEHERAAGGWQAEWGTITNALVLTGSAAAWGLADFGGGLLSRRLPTLAVTVLSQAAGFVALAVVLAATGGDTKAIRQWDRLDVLERVHLARLAATSGP